MVFLVSAQLYTHSSSPARALACHRIKLKVMNQAGILEAGANRTPQEEEYKILQQGRRGIVVNDNSAYHKFSQFLWPMIKKGEGGPQGKLVHISKKLNFEVTSNLTHSVL